MQKLSSAGRVLAMLAAIAVGGWALASALHPTVTVVALARSASSCRVVILPQPQKVQQGGLEAIQFTALPAIPLTVTVLTSATYPTTGTVYSGGDPTVTGTITSGAPAAGGGFSYLLTTGPDGLAILTFPIPLDAPVQKVAVQVRPGGGCAESATVARSALFRVSALPSLRAYLSAPQATIKTPELPPNAGSVVHLRLRIVTTPGASVTITASIVASGTVPTLGGADDNGTPYTNGQVFFTATGTASARGSLHSSIPLTSALLMPGGSAVVSMTVMADRGPLGREITTTTVPLSEAGLRLTVQPRGTLARARDQLQVLDLDPQGGVRTLAVVVVADKGAHLRGAATLGATTVVSASEPLTAGSGGRATLKIAVPSTLAPPAGTQVLGSVMVTSTFRGATITQTAPFLYERAALAQTGTPAAGPSAAEGTTGRRQVIAVQARRLPAGSISLVRGTPPAAWLVRHGAGYTLRFSGDSLYSGALITVRLRTTPRARLTYAIDAGFLPLDPPRHGSIPPGERPSAGACAIVATVPQRAPVRLVRVADTGGADTFCLRIAPVPRRVIALRVRLAVAVTMQGASRRSSVVGPFTITRVALHDLSVSATPSSVFADDRVELRSLSARGARITYRLAYPGCNGASVIISHVADGAGLDTARFRAASYGGGRGRLSVVLVSVTAVQGRRTAHASLTFTLRPRRAAPRARPCS